MQTKFIAFRDQDLEETIYAANFDKFGAAITVNADCAHAFDTFDQALECARHQGFGWEVGEVQIF